MIWLDLQSEPRGASQNKGDNSLTRALLTQMSQQNKIFYAADEKMI